MRSGVVVALLTTIASTVYAQPDAPPGAAALGRARNAWAKGDFDIAESQYEAAIVGGGLSPDETLDAYVHLGAARVVTRKPKPALEAFRIAALIDRNFTVPSETGKKGARLAAQARKEKARVAPLALGANVPPDARIGKPIPVDATLDAAHLTLVAKLGIVARDPLTTHVYRHTEPAAPQVHFEVPSEMTLPGASLVVRIEALDVNDNQFATTEKRVSVDAAAAVAKGPDRTDSGASRESASKEKDRANDQGGGFWSTAWPWVIGGTLLAAGGTAAYFALRPTDDVNVGSVRVQLSR